MTTFSFWRHCQEALLRGYYPSSMVFWMGCITAFVLVLNFGYAGLQIYLLKRRQPWPRQLGMALLIWAAAMSGLFAVQVFAPTSWKNFLHDWFYFPLAVEMIWNLLFVQLLFLGSILVVLAFRIFRPVKAERPATPQDMSRRKFLYLASYGAVPAVTMGMGVHGTLTRDELRVRELKIPIVGLPPELEGFSIAHVSDLHSGLFCGTTRLKNITDTTNDLKADLVVVTGDIINNEMGEFPPAIAAIKRLESRYGTQICEGNHDLIPGRNLVFDACAENNVPMLRNSCLVLPVAGRRILLGGLAWAKQAPQGLPDYINHLYPERQEGDVRILLAHHPHMFDAASSTDLVLAGHSHGGQIMFGNVGLGPYFFRYWSGLYRHGATSLVVSNGCGDWFPCRIGAPAEVGLLRLTKA